MIERECQECFNRFAPIRNKHARFCSTKCQQKGYRKSLKEKECSSSLCDKSFTPYDYRQRFCSRSCSASHNNKQFVKRKRLSGIYNCLWCEKKLEQSQKKYCSKVCEMAFRKVLLYNDWIEGYSQASESNGHLTRWAKTLMLEMCDYTCSCGWNTPNPLTDLPILTVNHINGDWKNNFIWNLEILCYNCHTLTPTFGALNIGSSSGRREYNFSNGR